MARTQVASKPADFHAEFAGRHTGSLLEIDAWIPSEINRISPLVERLMRLITGSRCIAGEEDAVELALREAVSNSVIHGNRLDARKLVHVCCRCKVGKGISLIVSDQGPGFEARTIPDPLSVENLEAEHGRGIHLMKLCMDKVTFEGIGNVVRMQKAPARTKGSRLRRNDEIVRSNSSNIARCADEVLKRANSIGTQAR